MRRTNNDRKSKKEFRMGIINQIKDLTPSERGILVEKFTNEIHKMPFSKKYTLSRATIYRWLKEYHANNNAGTALMGKVRFDNDTFKALSEQQKNAVTRWRYDNPYRSLNDLREELMEHESTSCPQIPSTATIGRFLRSKNLSRHDLTKNGKPPCKARLAFEAEYPQQIWMADTKGPDVYVQDPNDPDNMVCARPIVFIDDHSRFLTAAKYVIVENEDAIMDLFFDAVLRFGICEILYCDQGSPYMGNRMKRAAAIIGCRVLHPKRGDCPAKGKIEKVLLTCHQRFEHEMMVNKDIKPTLDEYNKYLDAYISQDYHKNVHSITGQAPEERFFSFPPQLRRWIGRDNLMLIFLPVRKAKVSKVGLVRFNNLKYLVGDAELWDKEVEIRYRASESHKVFVWRKDKYYGEAFVYTEENDFIKRQELMEKITRVPEITLPDPTTVPKYSRLERILHKYREEVETMDMNEQIMFSREKKNMVRATLLKKDSANESIPVKRENELEYDQLVLLLSRLLRKSFAPSERFAIHTLFRSLVSVDEKVVRSTVGRLLGNEVPTEDLKEYLEEIRLASMIDKSSKERKVDK